jgi:hypothetical protein
MARWPKKNWSKGRTAGHIFGREPFNDYFINILFLLSKWFQTRRFLWVFPIGSYVKLSLAVVAILVRGMKCRTQFWKGTTQDFDGIVIGWSSSKIVSGSRALPPRWLPQCSCVVIESSFDPGERLQAPGSLWFHQILEILIVFVLYFKIVKLSSVVGAIMFEGPNRRIHFWKITIQWLFHQNFVLSEQMVSDKKIFMGISHRVLC